MGVAMGSNEMSVAALEAVLAAEAPQPLLAVDVVQGVPVYRADAVRQSLADAATRAAVGRAWMAEWAEVLSQGAGVLVLRGMVDDAALMDAVTAAFHGLIEDERRAGTGGGDHFAKPGANDRVWNALEKLCLREPALFARYYANEVLALVCEAWLGPGYQITSQVNCVNPGGAAQTPHRDYHLGFMTPERARCYPAHVHALSPLLTLQGAVAHVDMPLESGPTLLLPHSQKYAAGYLVAGLPAFDAFFARAHVQLPLSCGDAVFFNPALIHAAGHNRSAGIRRMANLLQVSSAFGRAMETVDRDRMSRAVYPVLQAALADGRMSMDEAGRAVAACAEGYAFPTDLDRDPPVGGLAPDSAQVQMRRALAEGWTPGRFEEAARARARRQRRAVSD